MLFRSSDGGKLQHAETIDSEEKRDSNLNLEPSLPHEQKIANSTKSGSEKTTDPGARNSVAQIAVSAAIETSNRLERESTKKANEQSFSRSFGDAVGEETIKVSGNSPEHELGGGISDSEKSIFQITNRVHQKFAREQAR